MNKNLLTPVIIGILALSLGFFGGLTYQKGKTPLRQGSRTGMVNGLKTTDGNSPVRDSLLKGNGPVSGKIIKMDDTSLTVQLADGSNKIVLLSDQTKINNTSEGSRNDLVEGSEIMVIGTTINGAVTAESISLGSNFIRRQYSPPGQ
jgi:hypothetical protein